MRIVKNTPVEESGRFTFEAPLIELVKELKRLNELLETHTVKESAPPTGKIIHEYKERIFPENLEETLATPGSQPTTPEKKIHCFDCGAQTMEDCVHHKETDAPEKKCDCGMGYPAVFHVYGCPNYKRHGEKKYEGNSTIPMPTSSYEVTCGRCEKSIKHSCGRV